MSDTEEVPELSAEAKALECARLRLIAPPPLPLRKRPSRVPPEVMAAAAVVSLVLGAQVLYLVLRTPISPAAEPVAEVEVKPAEPKKKLEAANVNDGADLKAVAQAWRTGDSEGARRLASQSCDSPGCAPLAAELSRMLGFIEGIDQLSAAEARELAAFDEKLWGSGDSALRRRLEAGKPSPPSPSALKLAEHLFDLAGEEKKAKNFQAAAVRLEKCIKIAPGYHPCYRMLGSVYASIAIRDQSDLAMERARSAYQAFLEVAPPEDEYFPKVEAILEAAPSVKRAVPAVVRVLLSVDGSVKLPLRRTISRLTVGDPNVIDAKVLGPETVQVEAMRAGKTTVMVRYTDGGLTTLEVEVKVPERRVERVAELFADANKAMAAKDFVLASAFSRQVLDLEPNHAGARSILNTLRGKAREAYLRGYQRREETPAEAITEFELVVLLTPPEDEIHQKAMSRLRELKR